MFHTHTPCRSRVVFRKNDTMWEHISQNMWHTATQDVSEGLEDARARRPSLKAVICSTVKALVGSLVRAVGPVPDGGGAKRRSWTWAANVAILARDVCVAEGRYPRQRDGGDLLKGGKGGSSLEGGGGDLLKGGRGVFFRRRGGIFLRRGRGVFFRRGDLLKWAGFLGGDLLKGGKGGSSLGEV